MSNYVPIRVKTITEYHRLMNLPKPLHPMISLIDLTTVTLPVSQGLFQLVFDFYSISLKKGLGTKFRYGQTAADFDEGTLFFIAPGQVFGMELAEHPASRPTGWMILVHPDLFWNTHLAQTIKKYEFFRYSVNEALHLSDKEETLLADLARSMEREYQTNMDGLTQNILSGQMELMLHYGERFYQRQFIMRKVVHHEILSRLEQLVENYFASDALVTQGLPTVGYIADQLHISPTYLSNLLKSLIGQSTQHYLHDKLMELAKEKLSTTNASISEIAYELGFEHLPSFTKLFKTKTSLSPMKFRESFH